MYVSKKIFYIYVLQGIIFLYILPLFFFFSPSFPSLFSKSQLFAVFILFLFPHPSLSLCFFSSSSYFYSLPYLNDFLLCTIYIFRLFFFSHSSLLLVFLIFLILSFVHPSLPFLLLFSSPTTLQYVLTNSC